MIGIDFRKFFWLFMENVFRCSKDSCGENSEGVVVVEWMEVRIWVEVVEMERGVRYE